MSPVITRRSWRGPRWTSAATGAPESRVEAISAVRAIGVLVAVTGVLIVVMGIEAAAFGYLGLSRYQKKSGRLMRMFSPQDQNYFAYLNAAVKLGALVQVAGTIVGIAGGAMLLRPYAAQRILVRMRVLRVSPVQDNHSSTSTLSHITPHT